MLFYDVLYGRIKVPLALEYDPDLHIEQLETPDAWRRAIRNIYTSTKTNEATLQ
jgi:hypothetical protein